MPRRGGKTKKERSGSFRGRGVRARGALFFADGVSRRREPEDGRLTKGLPVL